MRGLDFTACSARGGRLFTCCTHRARHRGASDHGSLVCSTEANLLLRWLHVIVVIAWIGLSLYFVFLGNNLLATQADVQQHAQQSYQQVVVSQTMPLSNSTQMTEAGRALLACWFGQRKP